MIPNGRRWIVGDDNDDPHAGNPVDATYRYVLRRTTAVTLTSVSDGGWRTFISRGYFVTWQMAEVAILATSPQHDRSLSLS